MQGGFVLEVGRPTAGGLADFFSACKQDAFTHQGSQCGSVVIGAQQEAGVEFIGMRWRLFLACLIAHSRCGSFADGILFGEVGG